MASLKARNAAFKINTCKRHLLSESKLLPLFCLTDKEGVLHAINGTWNVPYVTEAEAAIGERLGRDGSMTVLEAIPPAILPGEKIAPILFEIRQLHNPDSGAFRERNKLNLEKEAADEQARKGGNSNLPPPELTRDQMDKISIASCVVGWENMIGDDGNGNGIPMEFNDANLIALMDDVEQAPVCINRYAGDAKKFESHSRAGKSK